MFDQDEANHIDRTWWRASIHTQDSTPTSVKKHLSKQIYIYISSEFYVLAFTPIKEIQITQTYGVNKKNVIEDNKKTGFKEYEDDD